MICSWCRVEYDGSPLYHICPDGSTFDVRIKKTQEEIDDEHDRQDKVKRAYVTKKDRLAFEELIKKNWSEYDIEFLKSVGIKR